MSDQDFFFDEDEKPAEKPAEKTPSKGSSASRPSPKSASAPVSGERTVSMTVAALIGVISLLLGVIIGLFVQPGGGTATNGTSGTGTGIAPQLTEEQIQQGLPEGHPAIPNDMSGTATDTGSTEGTPTE